MKKHKHNFKNKYKYQILQLWFPKTVCYVSKNTKKFQIISKNEIFKTKLVASKQKMRFVITLCSMKNIIPKAGFKNKISKSKSNEN